MISAGFFEFVWDDGVLGIGCVTRNTVYEGDRVKKVVKMTREPGFDRVHVISDFKMTRITEMKIVRVTGR